jgi:hypothetical protein
MFEGSQISGSRFWLVIFPSVIWPCAAYAAWNIYKIATTGDYAHLSDFVKLVAFVVISFVGRSQAKRKIEEKQQVQRARREWPAEDELKSGRRDAQGT